MIITAFALFVVGGIFWFFKRKYHKLFLNVTLGKGIGNFPANGYEFQTDYWGYIFISLPFIFPMNNDENHKTVKRKVIINGVFATLSFALAYLCVFLKIKYPELSKF